MRDFPYETDPILLGDMSNTAIASTDENRHRQILMGLRFFLVLFTVFTVIQAFYFLAVSDAVILARSAGIVSVGLNIIGVVCTGMLIVANALVEKNPKLQKTVYNISMRIYAGVILIGCLGQIHLAGSANSPLSMMIPTIAVIVAWILGTRESWIFFIVGTLGMIGIFILEKIGVLIYFPMYANTSSFPYDLFLDWRYFTIRLTIYLAISLTVLMLLQRFRKDIQQKNDDLVSLAKQLKILATTDSLTGLLNRRTVIYQMEREIARARRQNRSLALVMTDIDDFKKINDNYGHAAGDKVLREFSALLTSQLRKYDLVSRIGGEEFLMVIVNTDMEKTATIVERARATLAGQKISIDDKHFVHITASFGCTLCEPETSVTIDELLKVADDALYESKRKGKNRITCRPC